MMKHVWGIASSIPFVYIVYVLWTEPAPPQGQSGRVQELVRNIKLLLATWGFYPITYLSARAAFFRRTAPRSSPSRWATASPTSSRSVATAS